MFFISCALNALWHYWNSWCIFLNVEHIILLWNFFWYFSVLRTWSGIVKSCVNFFVCWARSGIFEFCVILFYMWLLVLCNFMLYFSVCGTCYRIVGFCVLSFCVPVERALVLCNFMLYFSVLETSLVYTRSGNEKFCVTFSCVWNALWYCGMTRYIFLCV